MTSKRETVLEALKTVVAASVPSAAVQRNGAVDFVVPAAGRVVIADGEPGEAEVSLSPLAYHYQHRAEIEVYGRSPAEIDALAGAIGAALAADRTLGGACDWAEPEAPSTDEIPAQGGAVVYALKATVVLVYSTASPLG
jgi:hypothetical protein